MQKESKKMTKKNQKKVQNDKEKISADKRIKKKNMKSVMIMIL